MANRYWVGGTGNWSDNTNHWSATSNGAPGASLPTSEDNVYFDDKSFTATGQTVTVSALAYCNDMIWTGALYSPTFSKGSSIYVYGSLALITAMTVSGVGNWNFHATTTGKTIDTKNIPLIGKANFGNASGGEWTLLGALITSWDVEINYGSLITNGNNITTRDLKLSPVTAINVTLGSSLITLSRNLVVSATNVTLGAGTSTVKFTGDTTTFGGGGKTFHNVEFTGTPITITGSNTFNDLKLTAGKTVNFTAGTTQTVTTLSGAGASGSLVTIQSATAGTPFTISKASGTVTVDYWSIKDCTATGGATFNATNSTNVSGNTGWTFGSVWVCPNLKLRIDGAIKSMVSGNVRIDGALKTIDSMWARIDGALKKL